MIEFSKEDELAIDLLSMRFFSSSHTLLTANYQIKALIQRLKVTEEKYEERMKLHEGQGIKP